MDEQQLQLQIELLVYEAFQGNLQATQQIQKIMQEAQRGDLQAIQIALMIQQVAQKIQQQQQQQQQMQQLLKARRARFGAKLNYIRYLKGQCPEGYKMEYYKKGGRLCKRCMKKELGGEMPNNTPSTVTELFKMEAAKCGKKMKKKNNGGAVEAEKCGGKPKLRKKDIGGPMR